MHAFNDFLLLLDSYIGGANWFVFLLIGTGIFFTIYLKFPQIRYFRHAIRVVRGGYDKATDLGDTSHFQALATAISGTVGTGNIAGVALAIHLGGPAALFWMLVTGFLGMTTKFVEVALSHKYREFTKDGTVAGGPMYYMKNRMNIVLKNKKIIRTGKWMGGFFALATILSSFGTGNLPQVNSIANSMNLTFGIPNIITGGILAVILAFVILGGIKRIAQVTSRLVPGMAIVYFIGALAVLGYNYDNVLPAIASVFTNVFTGTAAAGGFLGAGFAIAFNRGVNRGLFSNEAGQGSAPIAHASARAHEPVSEGIVAILEPFIDTIIICFLTGIVLLSSGVWKEKHENSFHATDMIVLSGVYDDKNEAQRNKLSAYIAGTDDLPGFNGQLLIEDGIITNPVTVINSRSVAENVVVTQRNNPFTGTIAVAKGRIQPAVTGLNFTGNSLIHSAPLSTVAFTKSWFGDFGKFIVTIGLLLFAFSTVIAWSYYGDRAVTYLVGNNYVFIYRVLYVIGFFVASFTDTTIIWTLAGITIAFMTIPNLIGILTLHREVKSTIKDYWKMFKSEYPNEKSPE